MLLGRFMASLSCFHNLFAVLNKKARRAARRLEMGDQRNNCRLISQIASPNLSRSPANLEYEIVDTGIHTRRRHTYTWGHTDIVVYATRCIHDEHRVAINSISRCLARLALFYAAFFLLTPTA